MKNLGPAFHRVFHLLFNFFPLLLGVQRTHEDSGFETVTDADLFRLFDQLLHKRIGNTVEEIQPFDC